MSRPLLRIAAIAALLLFAGCGAHASAPPGIVCPSLAGKADPQPIDPLHPSPYAERALARDDEPIRELARTRNYVLGTPQHAVVTPDGSAVLFLRSAPRDPRQSLFEMNTASGTVRSLLTPESLGGGPETLSPEERVRRERMRVRTTGFTSLELSEDGARVLLTLSGRAYLFDRATGRAREVPTGEGPVVDPRFSPDGTRMAYVRGDDVCVVALPAGRVVRVTKGGSERLTHGLAEFIAEEELDRTRGLFWSPDGARLLFEEADLTKVDVLSIADPLAPEHEPQHIAYPRPGRPNADVRFGIVSASGGTPTWVMWDRAHFPYVANASWPKGGPPLLVVLDRKQKNEALLAVDPATGQTRTLVAEHDDAWVNVDPSVPRWLPLGQGFLWASERSGEWQLELRDSTGQLIRELLPKGFGYVSLEDVDDEKHTAVVVASSDPTQTAAWVVSLHGLAPPKRLGEGEGVTSVSFGKSHTTYVSHEASLSAMPRVFVRSLDLSLDLSVSREIPSVGDAPRQMPHVQLAVVGADHMRVAIIRPRGFSADRRYPVIDAAYAGPHETVVEQSGRLYLRDQWIADANDAIVVAIDARGTPRRGRDWERAIYKKLGSVPLEGHVAALSALGLQYREMDTSRVGVFGWSFGGYFAALAVLARPDVYKVAVSGAPPADWRDYDTAYVERYLGMPDEDAVAYDAASLLTYASKEVDAAARPLLLVHGTADDNVWFLNGVKLADALERARRPFAFMPLAGTTHMLLDPSLSESVWVRAAEFLRDRLRQ